ncbi:hypothetical protein ACFHW1_28300 [Micromonospora sp. LOL_014]|uniref:hypothetical protein n=1 Tax=Micromonospora sp. LOL_014 TaxID=3345415 RepID=UPI003A85BF56
MAFSVGGRMIGPEVDLIMTSSDSIDRKSLFNFWLAVVFFALILTLTPVALYRHWRGKSSAYEWQSAAILYRSEHFRRGHVRATPVVFFTGFGTVS